MRDPRTCPGCGEDRLVTRLVVGTRTAAICDVCTVRWDYVERRTDDVKRRTERQTDVGGQVIDGP